jgi:hypothetical protein
VAPVPGMATTRWRTKTIGKGGHRIGSTSVLFDVILASLTEQRLVLHDVIHHLERLLTFDFFHHVVCSGKDSVTAILCHVMIRIDLPASPGSSSPLLQINKIESSSRFGSATESPVASALWQALRAASYRCWTRAVGDSDAVPRSAG